MKFACASLLVFLFLWELLALSEEADADSANDGPGFHLKSKRALEDIYYRVPQDIPIQESALRTARSPKMRYWGKFQKKRPWRPRRRTRRPLPSPPTLPPYLRGVGRRSLKHKNPD